MSLVSGKSNGYIKNLMNIHSDNKSYTIQVSGIDIIVIKHKVKYLRLSVSNLDGSVKVSSPLRTSNRVIEEFVESRISWIKKHQKKFQAKIVLPVPKYESGEIHYFAGKPYKLEIRIEEKKPSIYLDKDILVLSTRPDSSLEKRKETMNEWYRTYLKQQIPLLIKKWAYIIGETPLDWGVKNMKTRWGSCNTRDKRIWLSLKLAEKSEPCLEYVAVHEMVHLLERGHGKAFKDHMDRVLPEWKELRDKLNSNSFSS